MTRKPCWVIIAALITVFVLDANTFAKTGPAKATAKFVFLFIGDGMAVPQRNAAELYLAKENGVSRPEKVRLVMNTFPAQGMNTTYDLTSVIPDSASTATAIACGHKTKSGVIGMDAEARTTYENISEIAKKHRMKVGILSTVSLDHATPAAFYAHVPSRQQMYNISMQLAHSGIDYFAGGQLLEPVDKKDPSQPNALETAQKNGFTVAVGRAAFEALKPGTGKVIAMSGAVDESAAMYYTLDQPYSQDQVTLAEYLAKAIQLLNNPHGFFIMVEGGKIDWACHANDAAASIHDTLALDAAVAEAVKFYRQHPRETLIVVTGDHETGGMSIGFAGTQYSSFVDKIQHQKMSYIEFDKQLAAYKKTHPAPNAKLEDLLPVIQQAFGLYIMDSNEKAALEKVVTAGQVQNASAEAKQAAKQAAQQLKYSMALTDLEIKVLRDAFTQSLQGQKTPAQDDYAYLLYGGYEPLSVTLTTILNNKAGIGWTTYSHTGVPVQTSALGVGADRFNGYYDQTDIFTKIAQSAGLAK
jgi:alkaline phosphatase